MVKLKIRNFGHLSLTPSPTLYKGFNEDGNKIVENDNMKMEKWPHGTVHCTDTSLETGRGWHSLFQEADVLEYIYGVTIKSSPANQPLV